MLDAGFDLNRYMARIGLAAGHEPSLELLRMVVARHTATIPFENLDINLGRPIRIDIASVQAKLVGSRRGGYCFEQNTLLKAALEALGFHAESLMARVVRGGAADAIRARSHMLLRVDLPDGRFLADAGFGNLTPTGPLRMDTEDAQPTGHEAYRLRPMGDEILLQARLGDRWANVYRFLDHPTYPVDHEVANWFTSTKAGGLFTDNVIAARNGPGVRRTFFNGTVTVRDVTTGWGEPLARAPVDTLRDDFGIELPPDDLATVWSAARRFAARPGPAFSLD